MRDPKPINLTDDDYWRALGWPVIARDEDGHVITLYAHTSGEGFNEWLRECFEDGLTVTNLTLSKTIPGVIAQ